MIQYVVPILAEGTISTPGGGVDTSVALVLLVIIGLILWGAGRVFLRASFAGLGVLIGGGIGWTLAEHFSIGIAPWIPATVGAIVFGGLAFLAYRAAVAVLLAAFIGIAAPATIATVNSVKVIDESEMSAVSDVSPSATGDFVDDITKWLDTHFATNENSDSDSFFSADDFVGPVVPESAKDAQVPKAISQVIESFIQSGKEIFHVAQKEWRSTSDNQKPVLVIAGLIGAALGFLIGLFAPSFGSALVTALGGSALWLVSLNLLFGKIGLSDIEWLNLSSTAWMAIWLITALFGAAIQWILRPKRADKSR